jgi:type I restriction enzyme, S subunit
MATDQGSKGLVPHKELDYKFLYYYLLSKMDFLRSLGHGTTFAELSATRLKSVPIPLPPLAEQRRIVAILDTAFEGVDTAIANAEQNLANARVLFDDVLNATYEEHGETWISTTLGAILDVRDGTHDSPKYVDAGIPFVTQKNIRANGLSFENVRFITKKDHDRFFKRSNVAKGDILISMIGANRGMTCIVDDERVFSIKNVGLVKHHSSMDMVYLLYYLQTRKASDYVEHASRGGAQPFIGLRKLREFPVVVATSEEQKVIVDKLDLIATLKRSLE